MKRALGLLGVLVLAAAVWTGVRLVLARGHLQQARTQLSAVRDDLFAGNLTAASTALGKARHETAAARSLPGDPITSAWRHVPVLGRSITVVRQVATASDDLSTQVLSPALTTAQKLGGAGLRRPDGSLDLSVLGTSSNGLLTASQAATRIRQDLTAKTSLVPSPLADAQAKLLSEASSLSSQLATAQSALDAAPAFFGQGATKRWFVLVQQYGETRGTGGIPGGFAVVEAHDGRLRVTASGSNADLMNGTVAPPAGLSPDITSRYELLGSFDLWQNVNLSPDLPSVAKLVASRWQAEGGGPIDGVLTVDPTSLSLLLQGSPDLTLGGGTKVPIPLLRYYLEVQQYARYTSLVDRGFRKDELADVAKQIITRLTGPSDDNQALLRGVLLAVRSGHIGFATDDPALHPLLASTGFDHALPSGTAPVAYPVMYNSSGGKLDFYVDRTLTYSGGSCTGSRRKTTMSITLDNKAPAVGTLPPYVTFDLAKGLAVHSSTDTVVIELYGTHGATLDGATLNGQKLTLIDGSAVPTSNSASVHLGPQLRGSSELGLPVWQVRIDLPPNKAQTFTLHLDEPVVAGAPRVPEQPMNTDLVRHVTLPTCGAS